VFGGLAGNAFTVRVIWKRWRPTSRRPMEDGECIRRDGECHLVGPMEDGECIRRDGECHLVRPMEDGECIRRDGECHHVGHLVGLMGGNAFAGTANATVRMSTGRNHYV
jgi:hypothetical protein